MSRFMFRVRLSWGEGQQYEKRKKRRKRGLGREIDREVKMQDDVR